MEATVSKLLESEVASLREVGWYVYDRLYKDHFTHGEVAHIIESLLDPEMEKRFEEQFINGYLQGYKEGYGNGYRDAEWGYDFCDYVE